jgi:hypothetical protein
MVVLDGNDGLQVMLVLAVIAALNGNAGCDPVGSRECFGGIPFLL